MKEQWRAAQHYKTDDGHYCEIHFTFVKDKLPSGETVLINEGALKADTVVRFRPNARVIATAGGSNPALEGCCRQGIGHDRMDVSEALSDVLLPA